ncbi:MAG: MetQ/NlpA family ABC transporter substrate-binding protein [Treponema sp.]|nr:MetQ/NlpA family ABC transporter substrate-binding protein [Treponema sp.]
MNKIMVRLFAVTAMVLALGATAFAGGKKDAAGSSTLVVGATPNPHVVFLNLVKQDLAAQGINLRVIEYNDYILPNAALISEDLDANFFQHFPYLISNDEWTTKLVSAFGVHVEPFGLFSSKIKNISELKDGSTIAIPNDPTNGGRALLLLQANGLITLKADAGITATPQDITGNPKNLRFTELDAAQLPRALADVDAAAINGNYALEAGINPVRDALIIEGAESPYVNIVAVRKGFENDPRILALEKALRSQKIKDYIQANYADGSVVAVF